MTTREKLVAALLARERKDWRYDELAAILFESGYKHVSSDGSHRTWKHPEDPLVITLKETSGFPSRAYAHDVRKRVTALLKRQGDT